MLVEKMIKRGVDPKCLDYQKLEQATHKTVRQKVKLKGRHRQRHSQVDSEDDQGIKAESECQHSRRSTAGVWYEEG